MNVAYKGDNSNKGYLKVHVAVRSSQALLILDNKMQGILLALLGLSFTEVQEALLVKAWVLSFARSCSLPKVSRALLIFWPRHSKACGHTPFIMVKYLDKISMSQHVCACDKSFIG